MARHGRIDCLINNAGIASPKRGDFLDLETETFDTVMDVNLRGTVFFTQAAAKAMLAAPVRLSALHPVHHLRLLHHGFTGAA